MSWRAVLALTLALTGCGGSARPLSVDSALPFHEPTSPQPAKSFQRLAVTDYAAGAVKIFDSAYRLTSTITDGIVHPLDDAYDASGNLYVSNCVSGTCAEASGHDLVDVNEYDRGGSLIFSYSRGLVIPFGVAVDAAGNVYVADGGLGKPSHVLEYKQRQKRPIATCFTGLSNTGVAVDAAGDVFVSGDSSGNGGGYLPRIQTWPCWMQSSRSTHHVRFCRRPAGRSTKQPRRLRSKGRRGRYSAALQNRRLDDSLDGLLASRGTQSCE